MKDRMHKKQFLILIMALAIMLTGIAGCAKKPQDAATLATYCPNGENHEFDMEITQADCTQRGYTTGTCQKCGYTYMYDMVNALGHQWGAPVSVKLVSCTEDGLQSKSCSRCGITQEESLAHSGHSYTLATAEGDEGQEMVEYVCTICGDVITRNWDEPLVEELKEKTFLPDRSAEFTFLVRCDQGEDYLRNNLTLTGENGAISYDITVEENDIFRIAATEPYEQYQTYQVRLAEDMLFPEYNAKALDFSIVGPDRAEVEFNDDNLIFLKKLELREYGKSGLYELQWDEAAQRYYLTLFELRDIKPSMIGKVIGIGDYASTAEILADSTRELCFAKLEKISHNAEGDLLLELSVPQLSEVYDKLDIYFTGNADQMRISGDPEQAFMNAVENSEGFAEYLTATHLAAESYASTYGLVVTPLTETSKNNLKFELTKSSLKKAETDNACMLELGGKITYTIPLKSKAGHASGSIVMTCNAEITSRISAGGYFNNKDSVDLHLTNETTTTLSFDMDFNLEYSNAYEEIYLLNINTQKIHTATCRIAKKETNSTNLQKLTAQELSEWYHGDRETMQKHECKVCLAVTGLDGAAYAYNKNTGVLHCMNCRHVTSIKDCNLYTLYPDNTLGFTTCADCQPEKRQTKDFDNRMINAIRGSDWAEQVRNFQNILGDSIGEKKPAEEREPILSVPINIAGIFNIEIGVAPVFEFDMEASVNFTITGNTSNTYGIHNVGEGYETYHHEQPGEVDYELNFTGEADAKFGISLSVAAYPVGMEKAAYISISGQVGLYGHFTGILSVQGTVGSDTDAFCAARLEVGLYARMDGYWKILWFDNNFKIIEEKRWPLFKWGYDRMYYAFEEEEIEWPVDNPDEFGMFNLSLLMKAKYLDLTTMEYKTGNISPISKTHLNITVDIKNEDGSHCDFLEYIPQNGMIHKKDSAPESFTAIITVHVTPKALIDSFADFINSETDKPVYGYSVDPLVIKLTVDEKPDADESSIAVFKSFTDVINSVQSNINYSGYSASQKECCRGDFFEADGRNALVLMYYVFNGSELTPGYYTGLWVENSDGTISCLTDQLIEEVGNPNDAYVTVNIRKIDGKMYLNPYVRKVNGNADISKNQYYLIGDELVLEYNLYSEGNNYYLNQEQIDQSAFYSTQDKLNIRTYILGLDPNWSEGLPPQGYIFEDLLAQLSVNTKPNNGSANPDETQNSGVTGEYFIGTVTEPDAGAISISTAQELVDKITADPTGNYTLTCDIDLSTYNGGVWVALESFAGTLDGQGHVIRNLKVTSYEDAGLFLYVENAVFKDLGIEAIKVSGYENTGVVSAKGTATFTNCYVICPNLSGRDNVGGLIGRGDTLNLKDVFIDVSIEGNAEAYYSNIYESHASVCRVGGVIGKGSVDATNIVIDCDITITGSGKPTDGEIMAGGVIGCSNQAKSIKITNAEVDCIINVKTARFISWKTLSSGRRSYNNVDVRVGGLIGDDYHDEGSYIQNAIVISNCNVNASIDVDAYGTPCVGGFIGYEDGYNNSGKVVTISDSTLNGNISALCADGSYAKAGGIFGDHPVNMSDKITVVISSTTVQCQVTSSGGYYTTYGGIVSGGGSRSIEVKDSFFNVDLNVTAGNGDVYIDGEKQ